MLNVIDEFTHECLAIRVARKLKAIDVIDALSDLYPAWVPGHIRSLTPVRAQSIRASGQPGRLEPEHVPHHNHAAAT